MKKIGEIYKCKICGNIVEIVHGGVGELICCNETMELQEEKTEDSSVEKHVPFIEKTVNGILIKVGKNQDHPMEEDHYIEWIEIIAGGFSSRQFLEPGDAPEAEFSTDLDDVVARAYCNIHGLWRS